jgi:hypothetical protein
LYLLLDETRGRDNLFVMMSMPTTARSIFQAIVATVSGLFIASAVVFGAMALAVAGLLIGLAGALTSHLRPRTRQTAVVTLNATRTGRGWIVDPSDR